MSYEAILEIEGGIWQLDITLENLANLHFDHGNFERSLDYQRAWLRDSDWIGRACPEVCAVPEPGQDVTGYSGVKLRQRMLPSRLENRWAAKNPSCSVRGASMTLTSLQLSDPDGMSEQPASDAAAAVGLGSTTRALIANRV